MDVLSHSQIFVMIHMVTRIQQVLYRLFQVEVGLNLSSLHGFPYVGRLFLCMLFDQRLLDDSIFFKVLQSTYAIRTGQVRWSNIWCSLGRLLYTILMYFQRLNLGALV